MNNQKQLVARRPDKTVNFNYNESQIDNLANIFGVTPTFARLMLKYKCQTPDEYRKVRKANRIARKQAMNRVLANKTTK